MSLDDFDSDKPSSDKASERERVDIGLIREDLEAKVIEEAMRPHKTIRDILHGDILLNHIEIEVLDTKAMQRLRNLLQLGMTHIVYPSATHTRFSHSLGTLQVAEDMWHYYFDRNPIKDFEYTDLIDGKKIVDEEEARRALKYMHMILRLAALLHDLTTLPFGHSLEDEGQLIFSEENGLRRPVNQWSDIKRVLFFFDESGEIRSKIRSFVISTMLENSKENGHLKDKIEKEWGPDLERRIVADLLTVILYYDEDLLRKVLENLKLSRYQSQIIKENMFIAEIITNTVCADYIDYVLRDFTLCNLGGVPSVERLLKYAVISKDRRSLYFRMFKPKLKRGASTNELIRSGVLSELIGLLNLRIKLAESVHQHRTKIKATAMLLRAVELWIKSKEKKGEENWLESLYQMGDFEFLDVLKQNEEARHIIEKLERRELYKVLYSATYREFLSTSSMDKKDIDHFLRKMRKYRIDIEETLEDWNDLKPGTISLYVPPLPEKMFKEWKVKVGWLDEKRGSRKHTILSLEDVAERGKNRDPLTGDLGMYEYRIHLEHDLLKNKYESIWTIYLLGDVGEGGIQWDNENVQGRILADFTLICSSLMNGNGSFTSDVTFRCPRIKSTIIDYSTIQHLLVQARKDLKIQQALKEISQRRSNREAALLIPKDEIKKILKI